jgi:hypothetical protein
VERRINLKLVSSVFIFTQSALVLRFPDVTQFCENEALCFGTGILSSLSGALRLLIIIFFIFR